MSKEDQTTQQILIEAALTKINDIRTGNVFAGDFEAAQIIEQLLLELKLVQATTEED